MVFLAPLVLALTAQAPVSAPGDFDYAIALLAEGDSYRAIGELKRFSYLTGGEAALRAQLLIGQLYADAKQPEAARFHLSRVANVGAEPFATTARLLTTRTSCSGTLMLASCREDVAALPAGTALGLDAYLRRYVEVVAGVPGGLAPVSPELAGQALRLEEFAAKRQALPMQRPWLAGVLSTLLPGAGQVYNGRLLDAALALVLTGACAWGTVNFLARAKPEWGLGIPLGLLALTFYTGNIVNAVGDAYRLNDQALETFARKLEREAFPKVLLAVGPGAASLAVAVKFGDAPPVRVVREGAE